MRPGGASVVGTAVVDAADGCFGGWVGNVIAVRGSGRPCELSTMRSTARRKWSFEVWGYASPRRMEQGGEFPGLEVQSDRRVVGLAEVDRSVRGGGQLYAVAGLAAERRLLPMGFRHEVAFQRFAIKVWMNSREGSGPSDRFSMRPMIVRYFTN